MGMQDRDYYKDWKRQQQRATTAKIKLPKTPTYLGPMPKWVAFIVCCLVAYGFVALARDVSRLIG